ncbi:MAG: hypothetical protein ACKN82_01015, partial [Pirellula sp.]
SQSEFLRSKDTWFRPVQFSNGPDGCLYIVDMARETIEHPKSIPEPIKSQVDLTSGRDLGRIWRVKASGQSIRRNSPKLSNASTQELCQHLGHANGWHRETASQILIERQDASAIPFCRKITVDSHEPLARLHALSVLASLPNGFDKATWLRSIEDPSPQVRLWAWVFANRIADLSAESIQEHLPSISPIMQRETDLEVQMVMAVRSPLILAQESKRAELFATWLKRKDPATLACDELRAAIEFASRGKAAKLLWEPADWLTLLGSSNQGASYLDAMLFQMQQNGDLAEVVQAWNQSRWTDDQLKSATDTLGRLIERRIIPEGSETYVELSKLSSNQLVPRIESAMKKGITDRQAEAELGQSETQRTNAIRLLGTLPIPQRQEIFTRILSDCPSTSIQSSVIESWVPSQPLFQKLAAQYLDGTNPLIEQSILKALIRNESGAKLLLERIEQKGQSTASIPAWVWQALRAFPNEAIKTRAQKLSPVSEVPWESVAQRYREAWDKPGDSRLGEAHFRKLCASCHRAMDIGIAIGPSLDSYRVRPNEAIALAVAEPSREMDPKYEQQQIRTKDGEVAAGILVSSSAEQIAILTAQNQNFSISKSDVEEWKSSGKSLMPDGMLKELDPKALNDLIAFLRLVPAR